MSRRPRRGGGPSATFRSVKRESQVSARRSGAGPRCRWFRRLSLAVGAMILAIGLIELSLRGVAHASERPRGMDFHPEFGWRPIPGVEKRGSEWGVDEPAVMNSQGFREDEIPFAKPDGVRRIVALGDSFTFGQGVDADERFTDLLEQEFDRLEVVNLGVCGYGTDQEVRVFEEVGVRYEPDLVLLTVFLGNDLDDIRHRRHHFWPKPWFRLEDGELTLIRPESDWLTDLRRSTYLGELVVSAVQPVEAADELAEPWRSGYSAPLFHALVARLRRGVEAVGAELVVMFAHAPGQEPEDWARKLMSRVERSGVATLDTWQVIGGASNEEGAYLPDGHWSVAGHRLVAESLANELRQRQF